MPEDYNNLARAALSKLSETSNLDDLEKAASIAKYAAETHQAEIDSANSQKTAFGQLLGGIPSILVQLASLATVIATVWIQSNQINLSRQQLENTKWLTFLESVSKSQNSAISDVTFVPRLKTFLRSELYKDQVIDVAKRLLGQLTDRPGFDDLFNVVFPANSTYSINDMTDVLKSLTRTDIALKLVCNPTDETFKDLQIPVKLYDWGICDGGLKDDQVIGYLKTYPGKDKLIQARRDLFTTSDEEGEVSKRLSSAVRAFLINNKGKDVDLSGVAIEQADFSGVDLSLVDVTGASCDVCDFTGALLIPAKSEGFQPLTSSWWEADTINKTLLNTFISEYYPGYYDYERIHVNKDFNKEYYISKVMRLCRQVNIVCNAQELKFNQTYTISD
jgi:hypothetical protein